MITLVARRRYGGEQQGVPMAYGQWLMGIVL